MATKSELEDLIDVNLADESNIISEKHREVEHAFVGELYPDVFVDTKDTPPQKIMCLQPDKITSYTFITSKSGNMVTIQGQYITTVQTGLFENLFQFVDENLSAPAGQTIKTLSLQRPSTNWDTLETVLTHIVGDKITATIGSLAGREVTFSITYRAK